MTALVLGVIIGFATSVPIGPINLAVMAKTLRDGVHQALNLSLGAVVMDVLYVLVAMLGISVFIDLPIARFVLGLIGFFLLIYYGLRSILTKRHHIEPPPNGNTNGPQKKFHSAFFVGIALYLSNPTFLAYWIAVAGVVHGHGLVAVETFANVLFAVGVGTGTALWFYGVIRAVHHQRHVLKVSTIQRLTQVAGATLLAFGVYVGYELFVSLRSGLPSF